MKPSIRLVLPLVAIVAILAVTAVFRFNPAAKKYANLVQPVVTELPDVKMLVCTVSGDPDVTAGPAIDRLYKAYFLLRKTHKKMSFVPPRARWTGDVADRKSWTGVFGLPLPEDVTAPPAGFTEGPMALGVATWTYGPTAEILHKGEFAAEGPTIERLKTYLSEQGYRIAGVHEEEYAGRGLTVIRYGVVRTR